MKMRRVAKIDAISETQTLRRVRQNGLWWGLFFIWVASLLTATDNGWALGNGSLNGTYVLYDMQAAFGAQDSNGGWGVSDSASISRAEITFNGSGSWSGTSTLYELERQISEVQKQIGQDQMLSNKFTVLLPAPSTESISGTYAVRSDGSGSVTHAEGTDPLFVSADGSVLLMGRRNYNPANPYAWVGMAVGVKKGSGHSAASLNGTYVLYDMQAAFGAQDSNGGWGVSDSASISRAEVTFNGRGKWSGTSTLYELERQISEVQKDVGQGGQDLVLSDKFTVLLPAPSTDSISGTYAIGSDGSGSITHAEGTDPIFVSADGSVFLMGNRQYNPANPYAWVNIAVGVKKGSGHSAASLNGTYVLYDMQAAFGAQDSNGGWGVSDSASISRAEVTFNGSGSWSGRSTLYELERQMSEVQKEIGQDQVLSNKFTVLLPPPSTDSISGTYAIGSDGSGSITHAEGTDPIFVSADGSVFLMGNRQYNPANPYAWVSIAVGVKKTSARLGMPWIQLLLED